MIMKIVKILKAKEKSIADTFKNQERLRENIRSFENKLTPSS